MVTEICQNQCIKDKNKQNYTEISIAFLNFARRNYLCSNRFHHCFWTSSRCPSQDWGSRKAIVISCSSWTSKEVS